MSDTHSVPALLFPRLERANDKAMITRVLSRPENVGKANDVMGLVLDGAAAADKFVFCDRHHPDAEMAMTVQQTLELIGRDGFHLPAPAVWLEVTRGETDCRLGLYVEEGPGLHGPIIRVHIFCYADYEFDPGSDWLHVSITADIPLSGDCTKLEIMHEGGLPQEALELVHYYADGALAAVRHFILALAQPEAALLVDIVPRQRTRRPTGPRYTPEYTVVQSPEVYRLAEPSASEPGAALPVAPVSSTRH